MTSDQMATIISDFTAALMQVAEKAAESPAWTLVSLKCDLLPTTVNGGTVVTSLHWDLAPEETQEPCLDEVQADLA